MGLRRTAARSCSMASSCRPESPTRRRRGCVWLERAVGSRSTARRNCSTASSVPADPHAAPRRACCGRGPPAGGWPPPPGSSGPPRPGRFSACSTSASAEVGPEVAGVRLLDPPQEREPLLTVGVQAPRRAPGAAARTGRRPGRSAITSARAAWSARTAGSRARSRQPVGSGSGPPRHRQQPSSGGAGRAVHGRTSGRGRPPGRSRMFDARTRAATASGSSSTCPSPASRNASSYCSSGRTGGESRDAAGAVQADRVQPGRQLQVAGALVQAAAQLGRPAVAQPALRPLQGGARPRARTTLCRSRAISRRSSVRGPLRGGPLGLDRPRGRRPVGDQPQPAADQGDRQQRAGRDRRRERRPAADPPGQPPQPPLRPGRDRLAAEEAAQVVGQRGGAGVAGVRLLVQALQADRLQVARHLGVQPRRRAPGRASITCCSVSAAVAARNGGRPVSSS